MDATRKHIVAIIGGGIAGSEAAAQLVKRGVKILLFEQNAIPYGKIEEGLPKWHIKLRNQEEQKIDEKLDHPDIHYIPHTRFGKDITLKELQQWGVSAILLAFGAWRDRRLPIKDIDNYIGKGLYYQNQLVSWFNHQHEDQWSGMSCKIEDNTIIVGGGLASLDVVKIVMMELLLASLQKVGIQEDLFTLEKQGIPAVLKKHKLSLKKLGIKGCTLYYRRRIEDMPLTPFPAKLAKQQKEKIYSLRKRIVTDLRRRYCFRIVENQYPVDKIVQDDRLIGLLFQERGSSGKLTKVYAPLTISSIGSVPEKFSEIPFENDLLALEKPLLIKVKGLENVFAIGNAVTGRGNIRESLTHSRATSQHVLENFLQWQHDHFKELVRAQELQTVTTVKEINHHLKTRKGLPPSKIDSILQKVRKFQLRARYTDSYREWIAKHLPTRLENLA